MNAIQLTSLLLFICAYTDNIVARTTTSLPQNDNVIVDDVQSDQDVVFSRLNDAIQTLEDLRYKTNSTFQTLCDKFCQVNSQSSTCCHDIQVAALSFSHLSSSSSDLISSGSTQSQLSSILTVTAKYETEIHQMVLTAQRRVCHMYWNNGRECPLSHDLCQTDTSIDDSYCHFKQLSSEISSFSLILTQMIGQQTSTSGTSSINHDVITDVTIQDQRDLYILASACNAWTKSLKILRTLSIE